MPALTLEFNLHHHYPCKPLASWLREITKETLPKNCHSDGLCGCWALWRSLPWSFGKCLLLRVSWGRNQKWAVEVRFLSQQQWIVIQRAQFHHQTVQEPLAVQEFFLVRYYHWFSLWYPLTFSLLNAHSICLLRIDWTGNSLSGLNLSDLWVWHCSMLLLLVKNLWLVCYKYVSWIREFVLPTDTLNKFKNKSDFWM